MATFSVKYSASVVPIETDTLADNVTIIKTLDSLIDKTISSEIERTGLGIGANAVNEIVYNSTISYVSIDSLFVSQPYPVSFLFIKIISALSSGTPDLYISLDNGVTNKIKLVGVNDFVVMPLNSIDAATIKIQSSGATTIASVDILYASNGAVH